MKSPEESQFEKFKNFGQTVVLVSMGEIIRREAEYHSHGGPAQGVAPSRIHWHLPAVA